MSCPQETLAARLRQSPSLSRQREPTRARGRAPPQELAPHRLPEWLDLLRITSKRVETRRKVVHAVHEEAQVDAWAPGNSVPRHGSPVSGGHEASEHPEERRRGNCGGCVHAHGASAAQDDFLRSERTGSNWRLEEFPLPRKPGEIFVDRSRRIRSGTSNLVDHRPVDDMLGTQHVGRAIPS